MPNSAAVRLATVPTLNRDRPHVTPGPSEAALMPARGALTRLLAMVNKAPDSLKIPYALMGAIVIIIGLVGFMYTQSARATDKIDRLDTENEMNKTRLEILNTKVATMEATSKFGEELHAQTVKMDEIVNLMKQQQRR